MEAKGGLKWLTKLFQVLDRMSKLAGIVNTIGMGFFAIMMALIVADVVLRYVFNRPLTGMLEVIESILVIVVFFGIAHTAALKRHVAIDLVVRLFPKKLQVLTDSIVYFLSLILFSLLAWRSILQYYRYKELDSMTRILQLPVSPFLLIILFGSLLLCIILLRDFVSTLIQGIELKFDLPIWLLLWGFLIFVLPAALIWIYRHPIDMEPLTTGVISIIILFILLFLRLPVGFGLALVGFLSMAYLRNVEVGLRLLGQIPYNTTANFSFSVIPLFVLMGTFCFYSGLSRDLYSSAYRWLGHLPGGLSIATIGGCAGFAAICGDSLTTAVTMGTVALPEMKRFKYDSALATGCVAAGGTLGILIPPSIGFILYALLTNESIGTLFIAGILPGVLLSLMFMFYIYIYCRRNPNMGPSGPRISLKEKLLSLKNIWATVVLFVLVIGSIYLGVCTPTEAGALGAFGALMIGLSRNRFSRATFMASLRDAGIITAMVFIILIGADIFGYSLAASKLPLLLAGFVSKLVLPRLIILVTVLFIYLILGALMPAIAMIILTLPIFFPTIIALGYDPIWFGVIMVIMLEMAVITPPIGINVFAISGVAKGVPMGTIFHGIIPYCFVQAFCIALLIMFPQISTILPKLMGFIK